MSSRGLPRAGRHYVVWWKVPNLLMSTAQMRRVGVLGGQLRLWL